MKHFIFMLLLFLSSCVNTNANEFIVATVTHKESITKISESTDPHDDGYTTYSYYLIYTDKETFELSNGILIGVFNSSDIYGTIEIGKTYQFEVRGVRIPFLSMYKWIINIKSEDGKTIDVPTYNNEKDTYIAKVTGKERVNGVYMVYTTEGTFKIEDSLIFGRFNSSDVYGMIQVGEYYKLKVFGIRSQFLDSYRNIIEVEKLE